MGREDSQEEPPLTPAQWDELSRLFIRYIIGGATGSYLALQLAHEGGVLPEFVDFDFFESKWWLVALYVCILSAVLTRKKRRNTTPNP